MKRMTSKNVLRMMREGYQLRGGDLESRLPYCLYDENGRAAVAETLRTIDVEVVKELGDAGLLIPWPAPASVWIRLNEEADV